MGCGIGGECEGFRGPIDEWGCVKLRVGSDGGGLKMG